MRGVGYWTKHLERRRIAGGNSSEKDSLPTDTSTIARRIQSQNRVLDRRRTGLGSRRHPTSFRLEHRRLSPSLLRPPSRALLHPALLAHDPTPSLRPHHRFPPPRLLPPLRNRLSLLIDHSLPCAHPTTERHVDPPHRIYPTLERKRWPHDEGANCLRKCSNNERANDLLAASGRTMRSPMRLRGTPGNELRLKGLERDLLSRALSILLRLRVSVLSPCIILR